MFLTFKMKFKKLEIKKSTSAVISHLHIYIKQQNVNY